MSYLFVLYSPKTGPSGRRLARELRERLRSAGKAIDVAFGTEKRLQLTMKRQRAKPDFIVNVGETAQPAGVEDVRIFNKPGLVSRSSNKRGCRVLFKEKGVPAPSLWLSVDEIAAGAYPVVGRTTHHSKAQGFWFCKTKAEATKAAAEGATHFLKFVKNTLEFRVHIFAVREEAEEIEDQYRSIKLSQKIPRDASVDNNAIIKNHDSGWVFNYTGGKTAEAGAARAAAKKAMAAAGLQWGAVDVMVSKDDGQPYVLEINSAPCLTDEQANTASVYADWVLHLCNLVPKELGPLRPKTSTRPAPPAMPPALRRKRKADTLRSLLARMK